MSENLEGAELLRKILGAQGRLDALKIRLASMSAACGDQGEVEADIAQARWELQSLNRQARGE